MRDVYPLDPECGARRLHESIGGEGRIESIVQIAEERYVGNLAIYSLGIEMDRNVAENVLMRDRIRQHDVWIVDIFLWDSRRIWTVAL